MVHALLTIRQPTSQGYPISLKFANPFEMNNSFGNPFFFVGSIWNINNNAQKHYLFLIYFSLAYFELNISVIVKLFRYK